MATRENDQVCRCRFGLAASLLSLAVGLSACGSAYSGLTGASGLGADQYQPAVVVEPGNEAHSAELPGGDIEGRKTLAGRGAIPADIGGSMSR